MKYAAIAAVAVIAVIAYRYFSKPKTDTGNLPPSSGKKPGIAVQFVDPTILQSGGLSGTGGLGDILQG